MIILSFLVFAVMLVWMVCSVLLVVITAVCMPSADDSSCFLWFCVGLLSMVCWYQVVVWGEPWFRLLASAWM